MTNTLKKNLQTFAAVTIVIASLFGIMLFSGYLANHSEAYAAVMSVGRTIVIVIACSLITREIFRRGVKADEAQAQA